jgi:RNA-binding motif protein, X-linked 2
MNPLTQQKNLQKIIRAEAERGTTDSASWHSQFKHSAYIFAGGLAYDLTEGDILAVFAQYGEIVDLNLPKNVEDPKKNRGFAFIAYENQLSTVLAVDNFGGATVAGRRVSVEHVDNYKKKRKEVRLRHTQRCRHLCQWVADWLCALNR